MPRLRYATLYKGCKTAANKLFYLHTYITMKQHPVLILPKALRLVAEITGKLDAAMGWDGSGFCSYSPRDVHQQARWCFSQAIGWLHCRYHEG